MTLDRDSVIYNISHYLKSQVGETAIKMKKVNPRVSKNKYNKNIALKYITRVIFLSLIVGCSPEETSESTEGESTAGESTAGESTAGESTAGESTAGESTAGESTAGESTAGDIGDESCSPRQVREGEAIGEDEALALIDQYCGTCHQDPPLYGAPYPLTDRESLLEGPSGLRPLDRVVARLLDGTMPPAGQPQPSPEIAQALIDWATCDSGLERIPNIGGFESSKPLYQGPSAPPSNTEILEMSVPGIIVPSDQSDQYNCFTFRGPSQAMADRSILRIEPIIDDARVVHHIVLYEANGEVSDQAPSDCGAGLGAGVYAWAPGQNPLHFKEGGLITRSGQNYILEIHYNNQAAYDDINDHSGVRIYHSELVEPMIDMMTIGPEGFQLPARSRTQIGGQCLVEEELEVIAMMPHMHEIGVNLSSLIVRAEGDEEDLITINGWDFNYQLVYDGQGTVLNRGDRVETRCLFENPDARPRFYGPYTEDEMCYNFVYVTPPPQSKRCDEPIEEASLYVPGECGPMSGAEVAEPIIGAYREGIPAETTGGSLTHGVYRLSDLNVWFESFNLGIAVVDEELSYYSALGAMEISTDGQISLDMQGTAYLTSLQGAEFMREIMINFSGAITESSADDQLQLQITCPDDRTITASYRSTESSVTLLFPFSDPVQGIQEMSFELVTE